MTRQAPCSTAFAANVKNSEEGTYMKRIISVLLCAAVLLAVFAGCGSKKSGSGKQLKIIATIYPEYEWVKQVVGNLDNVDVELLLDKGVDLHSFQPTAKDIINISSSDVFIYTGGESDKWVDDVLKEAQNKDMKALNLIEALGDMAKEEKAVEGMQTEESEEEEDEKEIDEHIWLSVKNASKLCKSIADVLGKKDPDNKDTYSENADAYIAKLNELDGQYEQVCSSAKNDTLIFADRFPFRYMTDDYNLKYYAAFSGCSAESEASFQTLVFLANKLDELKLNKLIIIDGSDKKIADAVIDTAKTKDVEVLTLNSMQSAVGESDTYLSIMQSNLEVLKKALN